MVQVEAPDDFLLTVFGLMLQQSLLTIGTAISNWIMSSFFR